MEEKSNFGVMQSWKQFNIADCIVTFKEALKDLKQDKVNACWKMWPEAVKNSIKIPSADQEYKKLLTWHIVLKGRDCDMVPGEAEELQEPNYELTQEGLDQLIQSSTDVEEKEEKEETNVNQWTLESFVDLFKDFRNLNHKIRELDPSMERSMKIA
jgi:hypothetical protein